MGIEQEVTNTVVSMNPCGAIYHVYQSGSQCLVWQKIQEPLTHDISALEELKGPSTKLTNNTGRGYNSQLIKAP